MLPSHSQPTAKRKLPEDASNPLTNGGGKRSKKDHNKPTSKRKLPGAEEQPGGLRIVREPTSRPAQSTQQQSRPTPTATAGAGPSKHPPTKKLRLDETTEGPISGTPDPLEVDVRAMEDEADHLRRQSRANGNTSGVHHANPNDELQFPALPSSTHRPTRRSHANSKSTDTSVLLPQHETPQIEKNKLMRGDAMARITGDIEIPVSSPAIKSSNSSGHRRKSSISRGKRISTSFQTMGIISQPHTSVAESSFYKHIDSELPEISRVKQLLIWSTFRNASSIPAPPKPRAKPKPKDPTGLPPLSAEDTKLIKSVIDDVMLMLAEGKVDTTPYGSAEQSGANLKPNVQNVRNRERELTFGTDIQQAQMEESAWKDVDTIYGAYVKNADTEIARRSAKLQALSPPLIGSAKAQGKRRATIDAHNLDALGSLADNEAVQLARDILTSRSRQYSRTDAATGTDPDHRIILGPRERARAAKEATLRELEADVEWKLDTLQALGSAALETTSVAEDLLDHRFAALSLGLNTRNRAGQTISNASVLGTYLPPRNDRSDPQAVIQALTRVDRERPAGRIGDSARRAAREVQRIEERGTAAPGDRRLTGVTVTPRKVPATPRRGNTPSRDRREG